MAEPPDHEHYRPPDPPRAPPIVAEAAPAPQRGEAKQGIMKGSSKRLAPTPTPKTPKDDDICDASEPVNLNPNPHVEPEYCFICNPNQ